MTGKKQVCVITLPMSILKCDNSNIERKKPKCENNDNLQNTNYNWTITNYKHLALKQDKKACERVIRSLQLLCTPWQLWETQ